MHKYPITVKLPLFLSLVVSFLTAAACTSATNSNVNHLAAGGSQANDSANSIAGNRASASPTPTSGPPVFKTGEDYKTSVRVKMLKDGWTPARTENADICGSGDSTCDEFPEMENCAGTGVGNCKFLWKRGDKVLAIFTVDRPHVYSGQEIESAPRSSKGADPTGRYLHSSKHEYGVDTFLFELKPGGVASYEVEAEGGDGPNMKGTWTAEGKVVKVTLRSPVSDQNEIYVFERQGEDLKMIDEPEHEKGYVGFVGLVFKKQ